MNKALNREKSEEQEMRRSQFMDATLAGRGLQVLVTSAMLLGVSSGPELINPGG
jgi:hypothetical protein